MKHPGKNEFADAVPAGDGGRGRESVTLGARLRIGDAKRATKVRIRNVSTGGLMAELPRPIAPDAAIAVELAGLGWVPGRVAWQIEGRVGIAFDREIDPVLLHRPAGD
ncbi:PilZ domain-containing protein [uncultured Sphingomonas sp.]|uniref:PilZ domain-containing protein n=1 Tax=uncultured Sphingomonas sp. TaxID=158754 RepID=UPI00260D426F|nr:PilZ domain-containing protein [uncultured Sphingomonas sp.]